MKGNKTMKIRIFDIKWDTTDEDDYNAKEVEKLQLPAEYVAEVDEDFNPDDECADLLSDKWGYCVKGCSYEWV
jgi:uncharacterized protein (UPF0305 family)